MNVCNLILIKSKRELKLTKRVIDPVSFPFFPTADRALSQARRGNRRFCACVEQSAQKLSGI